ncbi:tetratricopeptide repeat protein [Ravibacter arvi]|uniref:Tetratricopeptide repeat protein n=1 Tax=Ravibacter arvi TaxID=2051041 RepID=A0ABP8LMP4_9BACT
MSFKRSLLIAGCLVTLHGTSVDAQNTLGYSEPETRFRRGLEFFEKSNFLAARQEFDEYLKENSRLLSTSDYNSVTAQYYIAVTGLYLNYPEAEMQVDRFVRNHAEHPKAQQIYSDLGKHFYDNKDYDKAIGYLEKAVKYAGSTAKKDESTYQLAMSYYNTKQEEKALALFNSLKGNTGFANSADAAYYAGVIQYKNKNYQAAYNDFTRIENHPYYKDQVPNWIVTSLYHLNRYDELVTYGEKILKQGGQKMDEVALYVAEVYYLKGDYKGAVPAYERYQKMIGKKALNPLAALHYGHAQFRNENFKGAIDQLKNVATGKDSTAQYASYLLGISYLQEGNPNFALTSFQNAARMDFNPQVKEEASFNGAKVLIDVGNHNEALKELQNFASRYPGSKYAEEVDQLIADTYAKANNNTAAIAYIEKLKKRTPEINATYQRLTYNQGVTDFNKQAYPAAILMMDKSLKTPMDENLNMAAQYLKAESYTAMGQLDKATPIYSQMSRDPKTGIYGQKSLYALGYIHYNRKEYRQALNYFKDFVARPAGIETQMLEDATTRLADCYLAEKNYAEAMKTYESVSASGKVDNDYALFQKGRTMVYMNRGDQGKVQFEQLVKQYPKSSYVDDALFQIADIDFQKEDYSPAIKGFTRLINEQPKSYMIPAALLRRAQSYYNIQVYEHAITDFKRILSEFPSSPSANSALEGIQEAYTAVGRPEEFNQVLGIVRKNNPGNNKLEDVEFENARNLFYAQKYQAAIDALNQFQQSYAGSKHLYDSRYFLAASYDKLNDIGKALQLYGAVIQDNRSSYVAAAAQRSAELEIDRGNFSNAVSSYRVLLRNAENKKEQGIAWVGLMDTYYAMKRYDSSMVYVKEVINLGNVVPDGVGKARLLEGKIAYDQGNMPQAAEIMKKVSGDFKDEVGAEAKYWVAMAEFRQKKYKETEATVFELSKNFDGYDKWRVKSFLLLADVYVATNEPGQAKATLQSIIENSDDQEAVVEAKEKLAKIDANR